MNTKGGLTKRNSQVQEMQQKDTSLKGLIKAMEPEIKKALPSVITPERFTRMVFTALSSTPKLQQCTPQSFLGAMMQAAQLGLEPNTPVGQAYLIPYGNVCQFQLGYKGLLDLAYRSGEIKDIQAHEVHENDEFEYELGLEPKLKHIPAMSNRGPVTICLLYTSDAADEWRLAYQDRRLWVRSHEQGRCAGIRPEEIQELPQWPMAD